MMKGDSLRFKQVVTNLLSNAVKFTKYGIIRVEAEIIPNKDQAVQLSVKVKDNGIGIDKKDQGDIFKHFTQVDSSIKRKYGGTGLGLAITEKLVYLMGGSIGIESELGKGSTFFFTIQLEKCLDNEVDDGEWTELKSKSIHFDFQSCRVLYVEDDQINQAVISEMINCIGCSIEIANNGREALEKYADFNLIFMDLEMPEIDGYEATRQIRKQELVNQHIPIIALTAHAFEGVDDQCYAAGMDDYLSKPVKSAALKDKIIKWAHFVAQ